MGETLAMFTIPIHPMGGKHDMLGMGPTTKEHSMHEWEYGILISVGIFISIEISIPIGIFISIRY